MLWRGAELMARSLVRGACRKKVVIEWASGDLVCHSGCLIRLYIECDVTYRIDVRSKIINHILYTKIEILYYEAVYHVKLRY